MRIMNAAGPLEFGIGYPEYFRKLLHDFVTKSVTLKPCIGNNPPYRVGEYFNRVGLRNPGIDHVIERYAPVWETWETPVTVSIAGWPREFKDVAKKLNGVRGVAGIEVNLSCPNTDHGIVFPDDAYKIIVDVLSVCGNIPVYAKVGSIMHDPVDVAEHCQLAGAHGIVAINSVPGIVDYGDKGVLIPGGISGPSIKPIALKIVSEIVDEVKIPVTGCGGIENMRDIDMFKEAGAQAVQIGTAINRFPNMLRYPGA